MIASSLPNLGLDLDAVITAEQARAYKPNPQLFRHAHRKLGVTSEHVIHIAASQPLDMAVCHSMGIRAFCHRASELVSVVGGRVTGPDVDGGRVWGGGQSQAGCQGCGQSVSGPPGGQYLRFPR
ncbi:HAD family hydrolase [Nocardia xishanensis]